MNVNTYVPEPDEPTYAELVEHVTYLSTTVDLLRQVIGATIPAERAWAYAADLQMIDGEYRRRRAAKETP